MARKLRTVALDPARYLTHLRSVEAFKFRVGDYRAIVDVDWQQRIDYVLSVGHQYRLPVTGWSATSSRRPPCRSSLVPEGKIVLFASQIPRRGLGTDCVS